MEDGRHITGLWQEIRELILVQTLFHFELCGYEGMLI